MLENLKDLEQAGVNVLKIEGRARRPYYVGVATKVYKQALRGEKYNLQDLELAFNRGYTAGYFNGNGDIISNKQNHIGLHVGEVKKFKAGKKFNEIFISSNREFSSKSVLKLFDGDEEIVLTAYDIQPVGNLYRITTTQKVSVGSQVYLISDYEKEQVLLNEKIRRKVKIKIIAKENLPIKAEINLKGEKKIVEGELCVIAKNQPLNFDDLKNNFNKSELFEAELDCDVENVFLPKQKINEFRRTVFEEIKNILTYNNKEKLNKISLNLIKNNKNIKKFNNFIEFFGNFKEFSENISKIKEKNIIYYPCEYELKNVQNFIELCKNENKKPYLNLPNFALKNDIEMLQKIVNKTKIAIVVNNSYALNFNTEKVIGGGMNVFNFYTANYLGLPFIQAEGGIYKMPYMTMRHCPMKAHLNANCNNCPYKEGYEYVMQNGKRFKLRRQKMSTCSFELID